MPDGEESGLWFFAVYVRDVPGRFSWRKKGGKRRGGGASEIGSENGEEERRREEQIRE
jgi:hypothetical protein